MNRREFFNSMAHSWDERCRNDHEMINEILDMLHIKDGETVLDVGTGTGVLIPHLIERVGENGFILAVDMAEEMIAIAQEKFPYNNVLFITDNVFTAELPSSVFNHVICYSVFPHFEDHSRAVRMLVRHLKVEGAITICHSAGREEINRKHQAASPVVSHDYLPSATEIEEYMNEAGCDVETLMDTKRVFVITGRKKRSRSGIVVEGMLRASAINKRI